MTQELLGLMKKVGEKYGVKITEKAEKGGIFYRDEAGNKKELNLCDCAEIIENFCQYFSIEE